MSEAPNAMSREKKIIVILLSLILTFGLCALLSSGVDSTRQDADTDPTPDTDLTSELEDGEPKIEQLRKRRAAQIIEETDSVIDIPYEVRTEVYNRIVRDEEEIRNLVDEKFPIDGTTYEDPYVIFDYKQNLLDEYKQKVISEFQITAQEYSYIIGEGVAIDLLENKSEEELEADLK